MRTAAKAMVKLLGWTYRKAWRFFVMKWAACRIICSRFFQGRAFIYHVDDIDAI